MIKALPAVTLGLRSLPWSAVTLLCMGSLVAGCGEIIDPDNIVVAELDGRPIRQGELYKHIRRLPEADRPLIQTKDDIVEALNKYINQQILQQYAEELAEANRIHVPRDVAKQAYFQKYPEDIFIYEIPDPALIDRTAADLEALRAQAEFGIDEEQERLLREAALAFIARQSVEAGALTIREEEYEAAHALRQDEMRRHELIEFIGIRFPTTEPNAAARAAEAMRRVDGGESFESLIQDFRQRDPGLIIESAFENNPESRRFDTFWEVASGSESGEILLAFIPPFTVVEERGGLQREVQMPAAHLLFQVLSHESARTMTLEEAKPILAQDIYLQKTMQRLREDHGVRIFPGGLRDPAGLGDQFKGSIIRTTPE